MLVTELRAEEAERAAELGKLSGSGFDPRVELARSYARLWVARITPQGEPVGLLLAYARARSARLVLLEVRRSNAAAIALYRALGFEEAGVRRGYYSDDGEDALEFRLELTPGAS